MAKRKRAQHQSLISSPWDSRVLVSQAEIEITLDLAASTSQQGVGYDIFKALIELKRAQPDRMSLVSE